jgi:hypothetical protein
MVKHTGGLKVPSLFLQPGECLDDRPDSECGAFNNRVVHNPPNHSCFDCGNILDTDSDIDTDDGGGGGGGDDEDEDEGSGEGAGGPIDAPDPSDTPHEAMTRNTQNHLRTIITELVEGAGDTDFYTLFFADNFNEIVNFYMLFTKYGPYEVVDRPSEKKEVVIEVACAYMMMEIKQVRFQILAKVTGYNESNLVTGAIFFIATYKGEHYEKGAYLIDLYAPTLSVPDNFIGPMKTMWNELKAVQGNIRSRIVAYMGAFLDISEIPTSITQLWKLTGVSRGTLAPKFETYKELIEELRKP